MLYFTYWINDRYGLPHRTKLPPPVRLFSRDGGSLSRRCRVMPSPTSLAPGPEGETLFAMKSVDTPYVRTSNARSATQPLRLPDRFAVWLKWALKAFGESGGLTSTSKACRTNPHTRYTGDIVPQAIASIDDCCNISSEVWRLREQREIAATLVVGPPDRSVLSQPYCRAQTRERRHINRAV